MHPAGSQYRDTITENEDPENKLDGLLAIFALRLRR